MTRIVSSRMPRHSSAMRSSSAPSRGSTAVCSELEARRERIRVVARRERVADALDDRFAALHDVRYGLRALGTAERRREAQQRLHRVLAGEIAGAARRERHLRSGRRASPSVNRSEPFCAGGSAIATPSRAALPGTYASASGSSTRTSASTQRHAARGDRGHVLEAVAAEAASSARGARRRSERRAASRGSRPCRARRRACRRTVTARCRRCARACRSAPARAPRAA